MIDKSTRFTRGHLRKILNPIDKVVKWYVIDSTSPFLTKNNILDQYLNCNLFWK